MPDKSVRDLLDEHVLLLAKMSSDGDDATDVSLKLLAFAAAASALTAVDAAHEQRKQTLLLDRIAHDMQSLDKTLLMIVRELKTR
jgi:hypothetical protein